MTKHAIFFDLDGTLLSSHNSITPETISVVQRLKKQGHKIFIATGRQFYGAVPFHQQLELDTPLITLNGGAIYDATGVLLHSTTLDSTFVSKILECNTYYGLTQMSNFETPNLSVLTERNEDMYTFLHAQMPPGLLPNMGHTTHHISAYPILQNAINLYTFIGKENQDDFLSYLSSVLPETVDYRLADSAGLFAEFFPAHINKATGIEWIQEHFDLSGYQTMAFGDGLNDIEMLMAVEHGVAMKNGEIQTQQAANAITTKSNVDSGIADYLSHLLLT